jgi:PAS domain S-box-containing protein
MTNRPDISTQRLLKMCDQIEEYAIIVLDETGVVESWNKGAEQLFGYTANEVIGKEMDLFDTDEERLSKLSHRTILNARLQQKATARAWLLRKDRSRFWGNISVSPIQGDQGELIGYTNIIRDLGKIKVSADAIKDQEDRFSKMIAEISDYAIIMLDSRGHILNWNQGAQDIKGYLPEEIIGQNFRVFYSADDQAAQVPESLIHTAATTGRAQAEGWRIRKEGSKFWGSITITAIHDVEEQIIGFSKVTRDLTDKLLAEQKQLQYIADLDKKNKELEQFTYIASHDLQEPLRTISSFNRLLKEMYADQLDEHANMFTDVIEQSATRMTDLIRGLLDYSRIGFQKDVVEVDCTKLLNNTELDFFKLIEETETQLIYPRLPVIRGYATELIQLFQNIISNGIKYRAKDRRPIIAINFREDEVKWVFQISDNGIGMDPRYIHKIFLIFQRLHTRDEYQGSGIGLANCKKIVELHKGDIWVESVPEVGSQFYFSISKNI